VPSDANFVLFGGLADAGRAWEALLAQGVLVRDVGIAHHLRVTAGTPAETTAFLDAMAGLRRRAPASIRALPLRDRMSQGATA
jgi:histidinol-phosphate aminotransferase